MLIRQTMITTLEFPTALQKNWAVCCKLGKAEFFLSKLTARPSCSCNSLLWRNPGVVWLLHRFAVKWKIVNHFLFKGANILHTVFVCFSEAGSHLSSPWYIKIVTAAQQVTNPGKRAASFLAVIVCKVVYVTSNFTPAEILWVLSCSYSWGGNPCSHIFTSWLVAGEVSMLCCWWANEGKNVIITKQGPTHSLPGLLMCFFPHVRIPTLAHINCCCFF